jgi:hypothetical protein
MVLSFSSRSWDIRLLIPRLPETIEETKVHKVDPFIVIVGTKNDLKYVIWYYPRIHSLLGRKLECQRLKPPNFVMITVCLISWTFFRLLNTYAQICRYMWKRLRLLGRMWKRSSETPASSTWSWSCKVSRSFILIFNPSLINSAEKIPDQLGITSEDEDS